MPDFLINVRSRWDAAGVRAYVTEVLTAIRQLEAAAARGGPSARAALTPQVEQLQSQAQAGLAGIGRSGVLDPERYQSLTRSLQNEFGRLARVYPEFASALGSAATSTRQTVAAERAMREATVAAASARTQAAAAAAGTARSDATLARRGLEPIEGERPGARRARITAQDRLDQAQAASSAENLAKARETTRLREQVNVQLRRLALEERAAANAAAAADLGPGTRAQRFQARLALRSGQEPRAAASFPTGPQLLGSGLITSARFAVSGALLYGGLQTVREMVTQSSELERIFNQIDRQFAEVNQTAEGGGFKRAILEISRSTGELAKDVAFVAFQMKGAFGDTTTAVEATDDAIKVARVTGLELNEIVDSLVAGSKSFGVSIATIGDESLGLQERFGVLARETIKVFGDLGPAAAAAGLDIRETGALVAAVQQVSARSGGTIAENLGRVLPSVQKSAGDILRLYQSNPALQGQLPGISTALGEGRTGDVLIQLIRDYDKLTDAQQKQLVSSLGGERNAATLNALFNSRAATLAEIDRKERDLGKTESYFADLQETLTQRLARAKAEFVAFGLALFESGLGDFLKDLVTVGGGAIRVVGLLAEGFAALNSATGGMGIRLLEIYGALRVIAALRASGPGQALAGILGGGTRVNLARNAAGEIVAENVAGGLFGNLGALVGGRYAAGRAAAGGTTAAYGAASGGLAVLGGPALTALAGIAVVKRREQLLAENETEADRFTALLKKATDDELDNMLAGQRSLLERIQSAVGFQTAKSLRDREVGRRRISRPDAAGVTGRAEAEAALAAGLLRGAELDGPLAAVRNATRGIPGVNILTGRLEDRVNASELTQQALKGDLDAVEEVQRQLANVKADPGLRAQLEAKMAELRARYAQDRTRADVEAGDIVNDLKEAKGLYDSGQISVVEYLDQLSARSVELNNLLASGALKADPALEAKAREDLATVTKSKSQLDSEIARKIVDYNLANQELAGVGGPRERVSALTRLLDNPAVTDRNVREKATEDLLEALKAQLQEEADLADSAAERAAILRRGLPVPQAARVQILEQQVRALDADFLRFLERVSGGPDQATALLTQVAERAVRDSITLAQALRTIMAERIRQVSAQLVQLGLGAVFGLGDPARFSELSGELDRLRSAYDQPIPDAKAQVPTGTVRGSATERHRADQQAQQEAERRAKEAEAEAKKAREAAEAAARARFALQRAQAEGNPVELANIAIAEAQYLASVAENEAEALNAQAQLVQAQHALSQAQVQVQDAYRAIDKALAEAAGDTVRSAQLEIEQAEAHLRAARERGDLLGSLQAEAELIAAQAGRVNAEIQAREERINTGLALEKLSTQQAIAEYEAILRIPGITKQQVDQFLVKIHQLRKDASRDLQFDIPGEIKLPTLYEVRRLRQSEAAGIGYQDNRQLAVQYNVFTQQDNAKALADLVGVMSGQPRVGAAPRTY